MAQIEHLEAFVDPNHYFPIGFVASYWLKDYRFNSKLKVSIENNSISNMFVVKKINQKNDDT